MNSSCPLCVRFVKLCAIINNKFIYPKLLRQFNNFNFYYFFKIILIICIAYFIKLPYFSFVLVFKIN